MRVDIGNALATVATPGVPRTMLEDLDDRVATAHDRIQRGIAGDEFGYAALALPDRVDIEAIEATVDSFDGIETLFVVGIGGSALGAATLCEALGDGIAVYVLDNIDPVTIDRLLDSVSLASSVMHVVSRSGTTTETLANFLVLKDAYTTAGLDWTDHTLVTTGATGPLRELVDRHDLPAFDSPPGVPGRFSVLSTVALPAAAFADISIEALLAGARTQQNRLTGSLFDCPAYAYGATCFALDQRGASINAIFPYAETLASFAEWVAQLWAESLGKDDGGQTPVRAMGVTDQHSQLQLYRDGPRDKLVTFIRPRDRPNISLPPVELADLDYLGDSSLATVMDAEFNATEASLAAATRPSIRVEIDAIDADSVGALLYVFEAATILAGELYDVDTFTQPAVEWSKQTTRELLSDTGDRADIGESLVVE